MSSKKTKAPIEETPIADETTPEIQEVREQSRKETISKLWRNAKNELARIAGDCEGLEQLVSDKQWQCKILEQQRDAADDYYDQAVREEGEAAARVTRENARLEISRGTPAEAERSTILQSLLAALDDAKVDHEKARAARDEAHRRASLISILEEEISEAQTQLVRLNCEQREMEAIKDEQHRAYGIATKDEIRDKIDDLKARRNEALQVAELAEKEISELQRSIPEELRQWKDLRDQLLLSHGVKDVPETMTPTEKILRGYLDFCNILGMYGPRARHRINQDRQALAQIIELPESYIACMMGHSFKASVWRSKVIRDAFGREKEIMTNNQIEAVQALLEDEKPFRRAPDNSLSSWFASPSQGPI